jgi:hypothetical protein
MKPLSLIAEDAITLRGIIDLLEETPATHRDIIASLHVGSITAGRCCRALFEAGAIEHPIITRTVIGVPTQVPQLEWRLTESYQRGEIDLDPEDMAGGV